MPPGFGLVPQGLLSIEDANARRTLAGSVLFERVDVETQGCPGDSLRVIAGGRVTRATPDRA